MTRPRRVTAVNAFSLVEVTLAIGIVAVALVPLMGMIPTGLNAQKQALDTTVASQITQKISSDAEQSDFDSLITPSAGTSPLKDRYFSNQAVELLDASGQPNPSDPQRLYDVRTTTNFGTQGTVLSAGGAGGTVTTYNLATLKIQIANNPAHNANPFVPGSCATYFIFVARNEGASGTPPP